MASSQIERQLRDMLDAELRRQAVEKKAARKSVMKRLFGRGDRPAKPVRRPNPKGSRRGDIIIAGLGLALGFGCAVFPWYIFYNQEKFGIRAMRFDGGGQPGDVPIYLGNQGERVGAPMTVEDIPPMKLDLFATGTASIDDDAGPLPTVEEQPFPGEAAEYRLVHATRGRAMIADDTAVWVVQVGSLLPDNSTVARIEEVNGAWELVTSTDRVLKLSSR